MTSPINPRVVAVTGASGYLGERIVKRLVAEPSIAHVIGIDVRPSSLEHEKLTTLILDVTAPLDALFLRHKVDTVVQRSCCANFATVRKVGESTSVGLPMS